MSPRVSDECLEKSRRSVEAYLGKCADPRSGLRWLLAWAAQPTDALYLASQPSYPPAPDGGHWAGDALRGAVVLVRAGVLRARKTRAPYAGTRR